MARCHIACATSRDCSSLRQWVVAVAHSVAVTAAGDAGDEAECFILMIGPLGLESNGAISREEERASQSRGRLERICLPPVRAESHPGRAVRARAGRVSFVPQKGWSSPEPLRDGLEPIRGSARAKCCIIHPVYIHNLRRKVGARIGQERRSLIVCPFWARIRFNPGSGAMDLR